MQDCFYLGSQSALKCSECGKFGHMVNKCWGKNNPKHKRNGQSGKGSNISSKKAKLEQTNAMIEEGLMTHPDKEEMIMFVIKEGGIKFDESKVGQYSGFDEYDPTGDNDECLLYYGDWLADSAMTLHICNTRELFISYEPTKGIIVAGVGNVKLPVIGCGIVELQSQCGG
jgi:hypothetical protein